jgi:hypothetical protein
MQPDLRMRVQEGFGLPLARREMVEDDIIATMRFRSRKTIPNAAAHECHPQKKVFTSLSTAEKPTPSLFSQIALHQ